MPTTPSTRVRQEPRPEQPASLGRQAPLQLVRTVGRTGWHALRLCCQRGPPATGGCLFALGPVATAATASAAATNVVGPVTPLFDPPPHLLPCPCCHVSNCVGRGGCRKASTCAHAQ